MEQKKFKFSNKSNPSASSQQPKNEEQFNISELNKYYSAFMINHNKIEEDFKKFSLEVNSENLTTQKANERLEEINLQVKELKEDFKNNATFLVGYDKQNYMNVLYLILN